MLVYYLKLAQLPKILQTRMEKRSIKIKYISKGLYNNFTKNWVSNNIVYYISCKRGINNFIFKIKNNKIYFI